MLSAANLIVQLPSIPASKGSAERLVESWPVARGGSSDGAIAIPPA